MSAEDKVKSERRQVEQPKVEAKIEAPDGGYGWVVLTASFVRKYFKIDLITCNNNIINILAN